MDLFRLNAVLLVPLRLLLVSLRVSRLLLRGRVCFPHSIRHHLTQVKGTSEELLHKWMHAGEMYVLLKMFPQNAVHGRKY